MIKPWEIAVLFLALLAISGGLGGVLLWQQYRLARLEHWAEHAIGCWPDGCNFDIPVMPEPSR